MRITKEMLQKKLFEATDCTVQHLGFPLQYLFSRFISATETRHTQLLGSGLSVSRRLQRVKAEAKFN